MIHRKHLTFAVLLCLAAALRGGPVRAASAEEACFNQVGPALRAAGGHFAPEVRSAYLDWAEKTVLDQLHQSGRDVPGDCLAEVRHDDDLRVALFGSVFPPDPSVLQNYAQLRADLGPQTMARYRSLAIAIAVAKRIKGVEKPEEQKSIGHDYQPGFWTDESLRVPGSDAEKDFEKRIAAFLKEQNVAAADLYEKADLQQRLKEALTAQNVPGNLVGEVGKSAGFGERLKYAMVLLGQRPGAREPKPATVDWLRHLIRVYESKPSSTPTVDNRVMPWPLFPLDTAPWPLLMPLAHGIPLSEADYIWEAFQGEHGPDRYHTYGPYRGDDDLMPDSLKPSRWFWDAWPDRIVHGGMCVPISKGTVDLYSGLGKPAMWAGQPGHANLISFQHVGETWTAEVEQAFAGGPDVTNAQWYFDEDTGTQVRFRDLYYWAGAEYHLGIAVGMNAGLKSYLDTRLAANLFRALPATERPTLGVPLLRDAVKTNPYNPAIWYRLAEQTADANQAMALVQAARNGNPGLLGGSAPTIADGGSGAAGARQQYWQTVAQFAAQYAIIGHAAPRDEEQRLRAYAFVKTVPGLSGNELADYCERFTSADTGLEALKYDRALAEQGEPFGLIRMGQRYRDGLSVAQNDEMARQCLARAAARGEKAAAAMLGELSATIPADWINVTASSTYKEDQTPRHLLDGAGMTGAVHDNDENARTMWHTVEDPAAHPPLAGMPASPAWVRFDLNQPMKFDSLQIWNENQSGLHNRSLRKVRIYGSADGQNWTPLTTPPVTELREATGTPNEVPITVPNRLHSLPLKAVLISAEAEGGNYGGNCYGLSAVRFVVPRLTHVLRERSIHVTASSAYSDGQTPQHLIDGAGMVGLLHDNNGYSYTMWHTVDNPSASVPAPGLAPSPAWVRFDFDQPRGVDALLVWNHNQEGKTDRGFRKARIYGSADGTNWHTLTSTDVVEIPRASGAPNSEPISIGTHAFEQPVRAIIIAAEAQDGNYGAGNYGLAAVRFFVQR